jgi:hypothetical protein
VLVAAVLGPQQREDRELEVVRDAPEQFSDTGVFPVGETKGPMEWLLRDRAQIPTVARGADRLAR